MSKFLNFFKSTDPDIEQTEHGRWIIIRKRRFAPQEQYRHDIAKWEQRQYLLNFTYLGTFSTYNSAVREFNQIVRPHLMRERKGVRTINATAMRRKPT